MEEPFRMDKKQVRIVSLKDQRSDFAYWQTQPAWKRLAALESIRREYHLWKYGTAEPRLQRVFKIVKRTQVETEIDGQR